MSFERASQIHTRHENIRSDGNEKFLNLGHSSQSVLNSILSFTTVLIQIDTGFQKIKSMQSKCVNEQISSLLFTLI